MGPKKEERDGSIELKFLQLTVLSIALLNPKPIRKRQHGGAYEGDERGAGVDGVGWPGGREEEGVEGEEEGGEDWGWC